MYSLKSIQVFLLLNFTCRKFERYLNQQNVVWQLLHHYVTESGSLNIKREFDWHINNIEQQQKYDEDAPRKTKK
jgi:hypothetical protein